MASVLDVTAWSLQGQVILLAVLVLLSGFFSGSETALIGMSSFRRKHLADQGDKTASIAEKLMERPERTIIAILIGNNVVNTFSAALATTIAIQAFGQVGIGIATGVMTLVLLTFGEIMPKALATGKAEAFSFAVARPLRVFMRVIWPLIWIFSKITDLMFKIFKVPEERLTFADEEEFKTVVNIGVDEGVLEREEQDIIHRVMEFSETSAREAMVARTDMTCLAGDATVEDAVQLFVESGYSRMPVYQEHRDNVVGILYAKDVLPALVKGGAKDPVGELMKEPYFVPESQRLHDLFKDMRERRVHMALVLDEFGGTAGLITLEDMLEEIVGEIFDEYDTEGRQIVWSADRSVAVIDARLSIDDLNREIEIEIPSGEGYDTIGGFVFHELARPAMVGDVVRHGNAEFTVERANKKRVLAVRYRRIVGADEAEPPIE